jgi:hypothetical protein
MADLAATRVQAKEADPSANYKGVANKGCSSHAPKCATPPPTDGLDRLYHQLAEIHTISTVQMGWIGCTTNWQKSTPSPLCNCRVRPLAPV